jgi:hypothetical protein
MKKLLVLVVLAACGGHQERRATVMTAAPSEYPGVLHEPATLTPDVVVRQTITIHARHDGKPVEAEFDAVLQKHGDKLLILGFGPMNVKAFTITQLADRIEFAQFMGPDLPFSPRNIVLDVHRVFYKRLPSPTTEKFTGVQRGELDGEHVEETWQDGELRAIVYTRPDSPKPGAVRVTLAPGCKPNACEPATATLENEWFDYTLDIANDDFEAL